MVELDIISLYNSHCPSSLSPNLSFYRHPTSSSPPALFLPSTPSIILIFSCPALSFLCHPSGSAPVLGYIPSYFLSIFLSLSCLPSLRELTTNRSLDNLDCLVGQSDSQPWNREGNFVHSSSTLGRVSGISQVSSLTLFLSLVCFCHTLPCLLDFTIL